MLIIEGKRVYVVICFTLLIPFYTYVRNLTNTFVPSNSTKDDSHYCEGGNRVFQVSTSVLVPSLGPKRSRVKSGSPAAFASPAF